MFMEEVKAVKIITSQDNLQAEMILDTFKDNGIPAYKIDASPGSFLNLYGGNSRWGEDIYVAEQDRSRAEQILQNTGLL